MDNYRVKPQFTMGFDELIVDNFAGGGGASTGIEAAVGRSVDIAINHDEDSISMHKVNHPATKHYPEDVFGINPRKVTNDQPVGLAWFSPDCKHFSRAKGGTPVDKKIRGLAWIAFRWGVCVKPRIIVLENVVEFEDWGPLICVNEEEQLFKPDPDRKGETFKMFVKRLEYIGYHVEFKPLVASDFGSPTNRKRFFMVARNDGQPIVWPEPTHGNPALPNFRKTKLKKWKTAGDIIDFSIPCRSIFGRKKPLAENTMKRIAKGIDRYAINNPNPFIVKICQTGFGGDKLSYPLDKPLTTITTKNEHILVAPTLIQTGYGERKGQAPRILDLEKPLGTIVAGGTKQALVLAFMSKYYGGNYKGAGADLEHPVPTITSVDHNAFVTANLVHFRNNCDARSLNEPIPTLSTGGLHIGEVRAFLVKYYSEGGQWNDLNDPMHTITTKARLGLVTVHGEDYQIVDIQMRMLKPHELFAAQGFPDDYVIAIDSAGKSVPEYKQVARCGNAVPPPFAEAIVSANYIDPQRQVEAA